MTSTMSNGERRWASRRGGMTVLGKVAVPKPLNLPSQRLENHGLDPNVEIVPKGTHSWGSRSSSSTSNAWCSSMLSPNTDGGTSSPIYLSGPPSSCGSGTRPSTSGSDRAREPVANAWGTNSRPSSASGALTSNQTSLASLRPRSAETRPGSSHLSRFAEPSTDNLVAWSGTGTAEKLGVALSKNDGFSLTSGDFPTLGSEKETSGKSTESQDHASHGRPGSSSGGVPPEKERTGNSLGDVSGDTNVKSGTGNSWRREAPMYGDDGARLNMEKWHADPHPYPSSGIPAQHYDAWHGPPVNNHPGGVWYGGPPGGPPFGPPVGPGGFPMEPFPYYRPQIPPAALANPQPVPPPGVGPRGPHPKNGDMYRPPMHDAYIRPGMPVRPGFYPGPVPYEGYYGPPMGFCNSNERDVPFRGMTMGPAVYNRYSGQNAPDPSNPHGRSSGYGLSGKAVVLEQVESGHPQDGRGSYKVLLKQHDDWEGKHEEQKWDDTLTTNASDFGKGGHTRKSSWDNCWRADHKQEEEMAMTRMALGEEASSEAVDNERCMPVKVKSPESAGSLKTSDDSLGKKLEHGEHAASAVAEVSMAPKDPSLIQKIEGLNARARASDGRQDVKSVSSWEEQKNKFQVTNANIHSANEAGTGSVSLERIHVSGTVNTAPHDEHISTGDKNLESTVAGGMTNSRRSTHGMHGRADQRAKGRFNTQETDGWRKKSEVGQLSTMVSTVCFESSVAHGQGHTPTETAEMSRSFLQGKDDGESVTCISDPSDNQAQRAKMKELAKQRLKQREKEEEERTRDQRAKAQAKLEELNRRTQAGESLTQKLETVPSSANQNKQEEFSTFVQPTAVSSKSRAPSSALGSSPNAVAQSDESNISGFEKSTSLSSDTSLEKPKTVQKEAVVVHEQSELSLQNVINANITHHNNPSQVDDSSASKQKWIGHRQKENGALEKNSAEKLISSSTTEILKSHSDVAANPNVFPEGTANEIASNCESILPVNPSISTESSVHHRRKNRNGKSKQKVEEASSTMALPSMASKDTSSLETLVESEKSKTSESVLDPSSVLSLSDSKDVNQSLEQRLSSPNEEAHIRLNNQWKSQHSRRMQRNPQNKSAEKFHSCDTVVWAPVRSQNKADASDEASHRTAVESLGSSAKGDQQVQNNHRNKRAEMERYVPKPVAKEMAQHGSSHQSVAPSINQITSDETVARPESVSPAAESSQTSGTALGKVGSTMDSRNGEGKQNKPGKVQGSWRQRGAVESMTSFASNISKNAQKSMEHHQSQKPDVSLVKEQSRYSDERNSSDGWNMPEMPDAPVSVPVGKDQGTAGRGKRQSYKGHKSAGYYHDSDEKGINSGDTEKVYFKSSAPELYKADLTAASKENRAVGERSTSHWQPKSQLSSASNQRGSRSNAGQNLGPEVVRANEKDPRPLEGVPPLPQLDKDTSVVRAQPQHDQSLSEKSNLVEAATVGQQEAKKERKIASHKGRPVSPVESSSSSVDFRHEQHASSGFRKNGNQNSRFGREHEARGDWTGSGKDNKQNNVPTARDRHRNNLHYEYQPVGLHNNNKANSFEPPKDGSHNSGAVFRERGLSHSRRGGGNFYGRQSGGVRVDAGCD